MSAEPKHGPNCRAWAVGREDGTGETGWHCGPGCPSRSAAEAQVRGQDGAEQPPHELDLDAIEARARAATQGPWVMGPPPLWEVTIPDPDAEDGVPLRDTWFRGDATFIAHAREDVPALVAEVRRLRERDTPSAIDAEATAATPRPPGPPWVWTGKAGGVDARVVVGAHALFVGRSDGRPLATEEHRAALVEALGAAVAVVRRLRAERDVARRAVADPDAGEDAPRPPQMGWTCSCGWSGGELGYDMLLGSVCPRCRKPDGLVGHPVPTGASPRPRFGEHLTQAFPDLRPWRDAALSDPWAAALAAGGATDAEAAAVFAQRCHELEERLARALEITARPMAKRRQEGRAFLAMAASVFGMRRAEATTPVYAFWPYPLTWAHRSTDPGAV